MPHLGRTLVEAWRRGVLHRDLKRENILLKGGAVEWLENVIFKEREIANERLELTDKNSLSDVQK
jgi:serine/threonine protein kinase